MTAHDIAMIRECIFDVLDAPDRVWRLHENLISGRLTKAREEADRERLDFVEAVQRRILERIKERC